jgi:hypothetical protein
MNNCYSLIFNKAYAFALANSGTRSAKEVNKFKV